MFAKVNYELAIYRDAFVRIDIASVRVYVARNLHRPTRPCLRTSLVLIRSMSKIKAFPDKTRKLIPFG